jgi:hypothetical protein
MSVLQRPWRLATERARLIEMPGALFHFSLTPRGEGLIRPEGYKEVVFPQEKGERISSVMIHSRQRAIRMRWCLLLSALSHALAPLA